MKRLNLIITLFVVLLGGFIGFDPNSPSQTIGAEETRIRWVDVPKMPVDVLGLNKSVSVNLKDETVSLNGNVDNTTVTIIRDVETRPEYKERVIKEVIYEPDIVFSTKLMSKLMPLKLPKINADRNQSSKTVYKGYKLQVRYLNLTKLCNVDNTGY